MKVLDLSGTWTLAARNDVAEIRAQVPGTVLADLLAAGRIADPFVKDHEFAAREQTRRDWVYHREFDVDPAMVNAEHIFVCAEGLMTLAEVRLNGQTVGQADNMHRLWEFDAKVALTPGRNRIEVSFRSSLEYAEARQRATPTWSVNGVPGFQHIRQSHHTFGWDWGPALPDMGIFRPLTLKSWNGHRLEQVQVRQSHSAHLVQLAVRVVLDRAEDHDVPVTISLTNPDGKVTRVTGVVVARTLEAVIPVKVTHPQLWWPAGLGTQPLYRLEVSTGEGTGRHKSLRLGLRTLTVTQKDDQWGRSFAFCANGVDFFAMGADYIPEDSLISRITAESTRQLLDDCVAVHHNCIRVWGGGYYPDDVFYDLCDERGLVVWQDMLFACALYEFTPEFRASVERETIDNVRRLRHHACLGLWCGNNEMEQAIVEWSLGETPRQRADYIKMYEVFLPQLVEREDPDALYWPASPSSFGGFDRPNSQDFGDMHDWSIWHGKAPFHDFRKRFPRFMSEFGLQSYPSAKTLAPCIPEAERNPFSYLMELREKHSAGVSPLLHYLQQEFRMPTGFENHVLVSQWVQAEGVRYGVEHWRRNRGRCMGAIIWQLNDCWPGISWSSIDSAGRWKALHYASKRFFAPVLASVEETGNRADVHVTNDELRAFRGRLSWTLMTADGTVLRRGRRNCEVAALSTKRIMELDFSTELGVPPQSPASRRAALHFELFDDAGTRRSEGLSLFVPSKFFELANPRLTAQIFDGPDGLSVVVSCESLARFVHLDFDGFDAIMDDNDFDLVPGRPRRIGVQEFRPSATPTAAEVTSSLRVASLWDTWFHEGESQQ